MAYGFSALPSGGRYYGGGFSHAGGYAYFWSSSEYRQGNAYYMSLYYGIAVAYQHNYFKDYGFAVRCVKD